MQCISYLPILNMSFSYPCYHVSAFTRSLCSHTSIYLHSSPISSSYLFASISAHPPFFLILSCINSHPFLLYLIIPPPSPLTLPPTRCAAWAPGRRVQCEALRPVTSRRAHHVSSHQWTLESAAWQKDKHFPGHQCSGECVFTFLSSFLSFSPCSICYSFLTSSLFLMRSWNLSHLVSMTFKSLNYFYYFSSLLVPGFHQRSWTHYPALCECGCEHQRQLESHR